MTADGGPEAQPRTVDDTLNRSLRSAGSVVQMGLLALAFSLVPLIPGAERVVAVTVGDTALAFGGAYLVILSATACFWLFGGDSRAYSRINDAETVAIQACTLWLAYQAESGSSVFLMLWLAAGLGTAAVRGRPRFVWGTLVLGPAVLGLALLVTGNAPRALVTALVCATGIFMLRGLARVYAHLDALEAERARLAEQLVAAELLAERSRVARDLHDTLGSALAAVGYRTQALMHSADLAADVQALRARLSAAQQDLRRIASGDVGRVASGADLLSELRAFGEGLDLAGAALVTSFSGQADAVADAPLAATLQAVGRELLHNAAKHSRASRITLELRADPARWQLSIVDDGAGFDAARVSQGAHGGLANSRLRAEKQGGSFHVESKPGRTRLELVLPR